MALTTFANWFYSRRHGGDGPAEDDEAERDAPAGARADRAARSRHGDPLGAPVERRSRRLAADASRRARRPRARGLPRSPARQRHVRAAAEDRAGAHDDLVQRGHAPARNGAAAAGRFRSRRQLAGARLGRLPQCLASERNRRSQAPSARRRRLDGDRDAPHPGARSCPVSSRGLEGSFYELLRSRYAIEIARRRRRSSRR